MDPMFHSVVQRRAASASQNVRWTWQIACEGDLNSKTIRYELLLNPGMWSISEKNRGYLVPPSACARKPCLHEADALITGANREMGARLFNLHQAELLAACVPRCSLEFRRPSFYRPCRILLP
jgi:hypothetical protein